MPYGFEISAFIEKLVAEQDKLLYEAVKKQLYEKYEIIVEEAAQDIARRLSAAIKHNQSPYDMGLNVALFINEEKKEIKK